jgi:integrase
MALSDSTLKKLSGKVQERVLEKSDGNNLWIRVSLNGVVTFFYRYRFSGKAKKFTIGRYPVITLVKAREMSLNIARGLLSGVEPHETQQSKNITSTSLAEVYEQYRITRRGGLKSTIVGSFRLHFAPLLSRDINSIGFRDVASIIDGICKRAPGMVRNLSSECKSLFKWSHRRGIISENPIYDISATEFGAKKSRRSRFFTDLELVKMYYCILWRMRTHEKTLTFIELYLTLGCRPNELWRTKKSFFDREALLWTLPPDYHKVGYLTLLPLVRAVPEVCFSHIDRLSSLSPSSDLLYGGKKFHSFNWFSLLKESMADTFEPLENAVFYDFRRTARTNWSTMTSFRSAEKMLGHMSGDISEVYDQHLYLDEMRECYSRWWGKIQKIKKIAIEMTAIEIKRLTAAALDEYLQRDRWPVVPDAEHTDE